MSRCQILTKLPKAKSGSLSVVFTDVKPASIINVWPGPTHYANNRIDKYHPGIYLRQKALPSFRKGVIAWYAYPFAILTKSEKTLTWERTYEPWTARLARGALDGVLPPPLTHAAHPERLDLALNFILTKGNFHMKRAMRKEMMRKVNNAIALIVQRGADVDGGGNLVFSESVDSSEIRTLFYPGWVYVCAPQIPAYSLSIPEMVKSIRESFTDLSSKIIALEREWAGPEKRRLVLPSTEEVIAAKQYSSTLVRPNIANHTFQWYRTNMKEAPKRFLERRYLSPKAMPALNMKAVYDLTETLKTYPQRGLLKEQPNSAHPIAAMRSAPTEDTGDLLFGSTDSNALLNSLLLSPNTHTQNPSGTDEVDFSWLDDQDESDIEIDDTTKLKKDFPHRDDKSFRYEREDVKAPSVNTVPNTTTWGSYQRGARRVSAQTTSSNTIVETTSEPTSKGDEIDLDWLSSRSKPQPASVSSLARAQNRLKRGTGSFVKPAGR